MRESLKRIIKMLFGTVALRPANEIYFDRYLQIPDLQSRVTRSNKGVTGISEVKCNVIEYPQYIPYFLATNDCDYLILVIPGSTPIAIDRDDIDRMVGTDELDIWIRENWKPETMAICVP